MIHRLVSTLPYADCRQVKDLGDQPLTARAGMMMVLWAKLKALP
jgi:hypothetical protein